MTVMDAIKNGVNELAKVFNSPVAENEDGTAFAFMTPQGLSLIGVSQWYADDGYIGIRWRILIGQITPGFDYREAMKINHAYPESPYGVFIVDGKEILTNVVTYRFLLSWGLDSIERTIKIRFGGALSVHLALKGILPIHSEFLVNILEKEGFDRLLSIHEKKSAWVK